MDASFVEKTTDVISPFLWGGSLYEPETDFYWMRNRYYSKEMKRFINVDPLGIWGDANNFGNGFAYVAGMVVEAKDPTGLTWDDFVEARKQELGDSYLTSFIPKLIGLATNMDKIELGLSIAGKAALASEKDVEVTPKMIIDNALSFHPWLGRGITLLNWGEEIFIKGVGSHYGKKVADYMSKNGFTNGDKQYKDLAKMGDDVLVDLAKKVGIEVNNDDGMFPVGSLKNEGGGFSAYEADSEDGTGKKGVVAFNGDNTPSSGKSDETKIKGSYKDANGKTQGCSCVKGADGKYHCKADDGTTFTVGTLLFMPYDPDSVDKFQGFIMSGFIKRMLKIDSAFSVEEFVVSTDAEWSDWRGVPVVLRFVRRNRYHDIDPIMQIMQSGSLYNFYTGNRINIRGKALNNPYKTASGLFNSNFNPGNIDPYFE